MRSRILLYLLIGLSALAFLIFWLSTSSGDQEPMPAFPATVNRDCAPWDGAAFTVSIPYAEGSAVYISIWRSPHIKLPVKFSFPDESMRIGNATYLLRFSYSVQLTGTVFFWRVEEERPVEGEFDLLTEAGQRLKGKFKAEWGNEIVYCG